MDLSALPITHHQIIPESYLDEMGHMNVAWYTHLFSEAAGGLLHLCGMTAEYFTSNQAGCFALEAHIRYLAEVRAGESVTVRTRLIGWSPKRLHKIHFLTKDATGQLAATGEFIGSHIDMRVRRTSPMPAEIQALVARLAAEHARLPWEAPTCGIMKA